MWWCSEAIEPELNFDPITYCGLGKQPRTSISSLSRPSVEGGHKDTHVWEQRGLWEALHSLQPALSCQQSQRKAVSSSVLDIEWYAVSACCF